MITFSTGVPDMKSPIFVEGYGLATLVRFLENGGVDIYIGNGRTLRVPDDTKWRYAAY